MSSIQLEYVVMHHDALNSPVFGDCCFFPQKYGQSHATYPIIPVGGKAVGSTNFCSLILCVQHELHEHEIHIGSRYNQADYEQSLMNGCLGHRRDDRTQVCSYHNYNERVEG